MSEKIKVAICGYGNLGKGVELAINKNSDMELKAIFTRRNPNEMVSKSNTKVVSMNEINDWKNEIDVIIMCGGSATDLPIQVPIVAKNFCTVDSFDTHAKIPEYIAEIEKIAKENGNVSIVSVGWDPGLFSIMREYAEAVLPNSKTYTFWGKGVSQGHSDAIRRIKGVKDARQYTIPVEEVMNLVRTGETPELSTRQKHIRECFVVTEEGEDLQRIEKEIKTMPNYFAQYDTIVHFISQEELEKEHSGLPHGGNVLTCGETQKGVKQVIDYSLKLDSNPEFTGSVLVAYARAAYRMKKRGETGAKTVLDIPPIMLKSESREEVIKKLL